MIKEIWCMIIPRIRKCTSRRMLHLTKHSTVDHRPLKVQGNSGGTRYIITALPKGAERSRPGHRTNRGVHGREWSVSPPFGAPETGRVLDTYKPGNCN